MGDKTKMSCNIIIDINKLTQLMLPIFSTVTASSLLSINCMESHPRSDQIYQMTSGWDLNGLTS